MALEKSVTFHDGSTVTNESEDLINRSSVSYSNFIQKNLDRSLIQSESNIPKKKKNSRAASKVNPVEEMEASHRRKVNAEILQAISERVSVLDSSSDDGFALIVPVQVPRNCTLENHPEVHLKKNMCVTELSDEKIDGLDEWIQRLLTIRDLDLKDIKTCREIVQDVLCALDESGDRNAPTLQKNLRKCITPGKLKGSIEKCVESVVAFINEYLNSDEAKGMVSLSDEEIHLCRAIVRELAGDENAFAFCCPVDLKSFTDYTDYVQHPMDLQTVDVKAKAKQYRSVDEFASDVRLIWENCRKYNDRRTEIYSVAQRLGDRFEDLLYWWINKPLYASPPPKKKMSRGSSKRRKTKEVPNPWKSNLPEAPWEKPENKDDLTIVPAPELRKPLDLGSIDKSKRNNQNKATKRKKEDPNSNGGGDDDNDADVDFEMKTDNKISKSKSQLSKLTPESVYLGSVVVKKSKSLDRYIEGVVVRVENRMCVVSFHEEGSEEKVSVETLQKMEEEATLRQIDYASLVEQGLEEREGNSDVSKEAEAKDSSDEQHTSATSTTSDGNMDIVRKFLAELLRKPYERIDLGLRIHLLYFLCNQASETIALREDVDRKMEIILENRKRWRANPPLIRAPAKSFVQELPNEEAGSKRKKRLKVEEKELPKWYDILPGEAEVDNLSTGGEIELMKIKDELWDAVEDKTLVLSRPLENAMRRVQSELVKLYERRNRKLEHRNWKLELEWRMQGYQTRMKFLGMDRFFNRYLYFGDDNSRIFVQPPQNWGTVAEKNKKHENVMGCLTEWRVLNTRKDISTLLDYLNPNGLRECLLSNNIRMRAPLITRGRNWHENTSANKSSMMMVVEENRVDGPEDLYAYTKSSLRVGSRVTKQQVSLCKQSCGYFPPQTYCENSLLSLKVILLNIEYICSSYQAGGWMDGHRLGWLRLVSKTTEWRDLRQACAFLESCLEEANVAVEEWYATCYGEACLAVRCQSVSALACRILALDGSIQYELLEEQLKSPKRKSGRKRKR
uniref:Bromo domain-containing protein n=1 Tax=Aplanochytrium stocchinoi TaxID=215587 RepID=A0A7S3LPQ1_9STRA